MAAAVYIVGALITLVCSVLLLRQYGRTRLPLLLWSGLCFAGLTLSHIVLFIDLIVLPTEVSLYLLRQTITALSMSALLYGL
ncbi:MAG TPA: DUF5985 family protein, partial [Nevskiaceae bacterium]|nr:DUF5985 family protein [Nevskiaceae bacterium]